MCVFNLNPGVIDTDMQSNIRRSEFPGVSDFIALKDDGKQKSPEMVAKSLVWMIDRAGQPSCSHALPSPAT